MNMIPENPGSAKPEDVTKEHPEEKLKADMKGTFLIFTAAGQAIQVSADTISHSIRKNGEEYVTLIKNDEDKENPERPVARFNWAQLAGWAIYNG